MRFIAVPLHYDFGPQWARVIVVDTVREDMPEGRGVVVGTYASDWEAQQVAAALEKNPPEPDPDPF